MPNDDHSTPIWREPVPWIAAIVWVGVFTWLHFFHKPIVDSGYGAPAFCFANLAGAFVFLIGSMINVSKLRR